MKYLRFQLLTALLCLTTIVQAQSNVLRVDPVQSPAGKALLLPIIMENQSDITGVQFEIVVPYELATDEEGQTIVNLSKTRANGHQVVTRKIGNGYNWYSVINSYGYKYRIIIYSDENALILDNEGTLLTLQLTTSVDLADDTELPVYLSNVTLSDPQMKNVMTATNDGTITIKEIPRPDLEPSDVTFTQTEIGPDGMLDVAWKVKNIGKAATDGGWTEEISLVTTTGNISKQLATTHYSGTLEANAEVSRSVQLSLPFLIGVDGVTQVQVTVIPDADAGEHQTLRDNNTVKSANNLSVAKHLSLEITPQRISETSTWQRIALKLSRSGRWNALQSFKVTATNSKGEPSTESRLSLPKLITIQAGEASSLTYLTITNNNVLDADTLIHFKIEPNNTSNTYDPVEADLIIEDDELPTLRVTASKTELTEGTDKTFKLTIETERAPSEPLTVTLTSENTRRFATFPATITIPVGETTAQMEVTVVDDELANGTLSNKFTASAPRHNKGEALVLLNDDDLPVLELSITPTQVQESDGPISVSGTLKRLSNKDKKVTVKLTDDANGGLYFGNRTLELPKGTEEVNFNFGPVDNQDVDGDRTYTITAAVWLSSCSCSAVGEAAGHVTARLSVLDNDGKALRLTSANGTVKEGAKTTLTVTRNTNDNSEPVTVNITSDYDSSLEYEHNVTIPAGEKSVTVEVTSKKNDIPDDSHTVVFTVETEGYAKGTCWVMVTDQTLPDASLPEISANPTTVKVGEPVTVTLKVSNEQGNATLPATTMVKIYTRGEKDALTSFTIEDALPIGQVKELKKSITLPKSVEVRQIYAVINEDKAVKELATSNNTSATIEITVESPFTAELTTDKKTYNQNETITFTGQLAGKDFANAEADLYIVCDGTRQVERVTADATGKIEYKWLLTTALSGHAIAGICYPDASAKDKITEFDIYGLRRYNTGYIKHQLTVGETVEAPIQLVNPGVLNLTELKVEVTSKPDTYDVEASLPATIKGGVDNAVLTYKMTANAQSTGSDWEQVKLLITSKEGIELPITMYCYARMAQANLTTPNQRITTTMVNGEVREYPIQLINNGQGHTGKLTLALPDWITCAQGTTLSGINKGDTATLVLRMKPTSDMQLNVPVTGTIGFNVEYGNGTQASFSVTPVSDKKGTLEVIVADEYTYYTDEKPHVQGAEVVLRNSVTNAIVMIGDKPAQGKSDENGKVTFADLPEGYYKLSVTADNHDSYSNNIVVDPGVTTTKIINLSVEAIKVSWTVEETEIEDVYDIVTTVTYETNVPAPAVDLIAPNRIPADSLAEGESLVFYAILTNRGLINAEQAELTLPERTGIYLWEPLAENTGLTIAPQQSYIIPVKVTRMTPNDSRMRRAGVDENGCTTAVGTVYTWKCGSDHKWHKYSKSVTYKVCPSSGGGGYGGWIGGGGGGIGSPSGGGGGGYSSSSNTPSVSINNDDCEPCQGEFLKSVLVPCVIGFVDVWGCLYGSGDALLNKSNDIIDKTLSLIGCSAELCQAYGAGVSLTGIGLPAGVTLATVCGVIGKVAAIGSCIKTIVSYKCDPDEAPEGYSPAARSKAPSSKLPSYVTEAQAAGEVALKELDAYSDMLIEVFGDEVWVNNLTDEEQEDILFAISQTTGTINVDDMKQHKPDGITNEQLEKFVERINNSRLYDLDGTDNENRIHYDIINATNERISAAEAEAKEAGHDNVSEWWLSSYKTAWERLNEQSGSVCSSITLQIKQTMTMTRQAFRGTLTVFNGHETESMKDMKLNLVVSDMYNNVATSHEFQINAESLKDLDGELSLTSGWTLKPNTEGTATILFIPTKYAAPTEPVEWSFGGTLTYTDPYSGLEVTRELYPVTLTVKPSPELDLTYFMQRDVYGDDPLTTDIIEPMEDAEFALLINNKGYGDATNVKMVTQQPEITENEKGLFIDFEIVSSQVNGGSAALSFGQTIANDLGDIPAHSQTYAQWWLRSTLLGHFTSYNVEATHVTSYGNEDLSLLDQVTIHELIHGFTPSSANGTASKRAFLVNDVEDADDLPDQVYFTDATQQDVTIAQNATAAKQNKTDYLLTVYPEKAGWNYGSLLDPTAGHQKLLKVTRQSDNQELPLDNFWQTSRSLRDGQEWLYENRLHFVGEMSAEGESYILTYEERPDVELEIIELSGPVYDAEFAEQELVTADVDMVNVKFSKAIDPETFTADDLKFTVQGETQDLTNVSITAKDDSNTNFSIDLTALNTDLPNGYYVMAVQTADIKDYENYNGYSGKKIAWVLFRGGLIRLNTKPFPADAGEITWISLSDGPANARRIKLTGGDANQPQYGSKIKLTATPTEGYEFVNWTLDGEVVSTEAEYVTMATSDMNIVANFKKKEYKVDIAAGANGSLTGSGAGYYEHGTELTLIAKPDADFKLKEWIVNGVVKEATDDNTLKVTVKDVMDVKAEFIRDIYTQTLTLANGWNWVSTFMQESLSLGEMEQYANRIISQTDELFRDPEYGLVGGIDALTAGQTLKVNASTRFSRTLRGHLYSESMKLKKGWNWMAYPYFETKSLYVLANASAGDYITTQTGFAEFDGNSWEGTINEMTPGTGFLYKSADDKQLIFDFEATQPAESRNRSLPTSINTSASFQSFLNPHRYPNTMNVTAHIFRDGIDVSDQAYNIYALAGNDLRGVGQFVGQNHYLTIYGDGATEISFVIENAETGDTYMAKETLIFHSDVVGSRQSPFVLNIGDGTGIDTLRNDGRPMTVYSLQGVLISREATLKMLHSLPKGVYIINGQKCFIK